MALNDLAPADHDLSLNVLSAEQVSHLMLVVCGTLLLVVHPGEAAEGLAEGLKHRVDLVKRCFCNRMQLVEQLESVVNLSSIQTIQVEYNLLHGL